MAVSMGKPPLPEAVDLLSIAVLPFRARRSGATSRQAQEGRYGSPVIDLQRARDARRLVEYQARSRAVLDTNRRALAQLFQTGLIYSRSGARLGRELLLAHQHLLRVGDLLARLGERFRHGDRNAEALYSEVQTLLARTTALTARSDHLLARQR